MMGDECRECLLHKDECQCGEEEDTGVEEIVLDEMAKMLQYSVTTGKRIERIFHFGDGVLSIVVKFKKVKPLTSIIGTRNMKKLILIPNGWPCTLAECPPGHFLFQDSICFKSEYYSEGKIEAFNEAGEYFHGVGLVQPLTPKWEEHE